jgi:hypothetical protein
MARGGGSTKDFINRAGLALELLIVCTGIAVSVPFQQGIS